MNIKKNIQPNMKICKMKCDGGLDPKLEMYELTKHLNKHSVTCFLGIPGSGKTSLLYSLFQNKKLLKKVFTTIYLFQPSASRESMSDQLFNQLPNDQIFEELTLDNLQSVMDKMKNADPQENHCLIMDDMGAHLKDKEITKLFKEIIFNRRHLHCSCYILSQTYMSIPREIRKLLTNIFVFKTSKQELELLFEELVHHKKELISDLSKLVYTEKHNFLFINIESGMMFKNWDTILLDS